MRHAEEDRKLIFFFSQRNSILETLYPFHLAEAFLDLKCIDPLEYIARKGQVFSSWTGTWGAITWQNVRSIFFSFSFGDALVCVGPRGWHQCLSQPLSPLPSPRFFETVSRWTCSKLRELDWLASETSGFYRRLFHAGMTHGCSSLPSGFSSEGWEPNPDGHASMISPFQSLEIFSY